MSSYPEYLTIDGETTGATNGTYGNPFTDGNRLVSLGFGTVRSSSSLRLAGGELGKDVENLQLASKIVNNSSFLVGFNLKFDLHWLRRYGICKDIHVPIWDTQLAEFIICNQTHPYPSLEETVAKYGLGDKFIDIETEYWDKGIDTDQIPYDIVKMRVESDIILTSRLFMLQMDYLRKNPSKKKLIWVSCQDQLVLQEMEWNGLKYDLDLSMEEGQALLEKTKELKARLYEIVPIPQINWGSGDHLSAVLFGGTLAYDEKESYVFTYKDGRTKLRDRWKRFEIPMPRRIDPLPKTELAKEGFFSTGEPVLSKLKPKDAETKEILSLIKQVAKMEKRVGTYYHGLPKLYKEMDWTNSILHGNLNSVVAATGRLSSTKPNQQNMDHEIRKCITSRYD